MYLVPEGDNQTRLTTDLGVLTIFRSYLRAGNITYGTSLNISHLPNRLVGG